MPIYEYRCLDCSHEFEQIQKFSDPPVGACPTCGGAVQKLISRSAFHLKGDGWYVTDYARKGSQNGTSSTKNSSASSENEKSSGDTKASSDSTSTSETSKTSSAGVTASA
jgi:putative FmdB family regulatory protein